MAFVDCDGDDDNDGSDAARWISNLVNNNNGCQFEYMRNPGRCMNAEYFWAGDQGDGDGGTVQTSFEIAFWGAEIFPNDQ